MRIPDPSQPEVACTPTVNQNVCVQANVTVKPRVEKGEIKSFCVTPISFEACDGELKPSCSFMVSQEICVEIPLIFTLDADVVPEGISAKNRMRANAHPRLTKTNGREEGVSADDAPSHTVGKYMLIMQ